MAAAWASLPGGFEVSQAISRRRSSVTSVRGSRAAARVAGSRIGGAPLGLPHEPRGEAVGCRALVDVARAVGAAAREQRASRWEVVVGCQSQGVRLELV